MESTKQLAIAFNTSLSPADLEEEEELRYETAVFVIRSVTFVIAIVGIIGNTFVYLTATKMGEGGDSSGTMFMRCLAVSDCMAVLQDGVIEMGLPLFGLNLRTLHNYGCKAFALYSWTTTLSANLVLVALTFDRVLALWAPIFYFQNAKASTAFVISLIIQIACLICALPTLSLFEIQDDICGIFNFDLFDEQQMFQFVNVFVLGFILSVPLLCIVTFNGMVVYKLQNRMSTMTKKDRDITVSLVFVSVAFFVNMMITCVSLVIVFNSKTVDDSTRNLLNWLKEMPVAINNSINFFIYLAASESFRSQFFQLVGLQAESSTRGTSGTSRSQKSTSIANP